MWKKGSMLALCLLLSLCLQGCASQAEAMPSPEQTQESTEVAWPKDKLTMGADGAPTFLVYVVEEENIREVDIESYVAGVLAGEMKNDWPLEALKAQAILARTFVLKFVEEKESRYEGADISTDIEEAQAYNESAINDRVRQAVSETRGMVLSFNGELPYAWFHAHSGGLTERAKAGLGWDKDEPSYTTVVKSNEPDAPSDADAAAEVQDAAQWEASFTREEFLAALKKQGVSASGALALTIDARGDSGRAVTIGVNGQPVSATDLRIALGSTKMRSTLLTSLRAEGDEVRMAGKGYGHGVGMSQWGAYGMAEEGKTAEEIVTYYFNDVAVVTLW